MGNLELAKKITQQLLMVHGIEEKKYAYEVAYVDGHAPKTQPSQQDVELLPEYFADIANVLTSFKVQYDLFNKFDKPFPCMRFKLNPVTDSFIYIPLGMNAGHLTESNAEAIIQKEIDHINNVFTDQEIKCVNSTEVLNIIRDLIYQFILDRLGLDVKGKPKPQQVDQKETGHGLKIEVYTENAEMRVIYSYAITVQYDLFSEVLTSPSVGYLKPGKYLFGVMKGNKRPNLSNVKRDKITRLVNVHNRKIILTV